MTTVTTIRYEPDCRFHASVRQGGGGFPWQCQCVKHVRQYPDGDPIAGAYADFMATAGYVVEIEGAR